MAQISKRMKNRSQKRSFDWQGEARNTFNLIKTKLATNKLGTIHSQ
jgi:hypothetical protein